MKKRKEICENKVSTRFSFGMQCITYDDYLPDKKSSVGTDIVPDSLLSARMIIT